MSLRKFCWLYFLWTNSRAAEIFVGKNRLCVFIVADNPIEIESDGEVENDSDDNDNDGNDGSDDHNDDRITNIVDYLDIVINMLRDLKEMLRRMQHN